MGSLEEAGEGDVDNDALTVGIPATYLFTLYLCYKNILYSRTSLNSSYGKHIKKILFATE